MPGRTMVELISSNSEKDIAKRRALEDVRANLLQLTANLLRIARGAGKGYDVAPQVLDLLKAFTDYRTAAGHLPSDWEISRMLDWHERDLFHRTEIPYEERSLWYAHDRV